MVTVYYYRDRDRDRLQLHPVIYIYIYLEPEVWATSIHGCLEIRVDRIDRVVGGIVADGSNSSNDQHLLPSLYLPFKP